MVAAILFDLDGTLVNTDPIHFKHWKVLLRDYGYEIDREFYDAKISGGTNEAILADILPQLSPEQARDFAEYKEAQFRASGSDLQRLPGLTEMLAWVHYNNLKSAVVTNAPRANAEFMLATLDLADTFSILVLAEDAPAGKPDPAPYLIAMDKLGVTAEMTIAFEDSPSGIRAAVAAGIYTVGVASTHDPSRLHSAGASRTIRDFTDKELWEWLRVLDCVS
ncbi:haloacid dehalogenase superfamily [Rubidibacter lacunae KORDI 51-2]|uniref:Haloacid dehalogenase superfamily n=2 Tax=Rubidibacter TaxID=582491 RepID=U5DEF1_9CHRO|nr:haloacid dehalogenase superfamily [Rubidibacter lacunae KORDI 51-2]